MKKLILKKILPLTLATVATLSVVSCNSNENDGSNGEANNNGGTSDVEKGEVVELEFWGWWSSEARKPHIEYMVNSFNESQDEIHVTYVDIPWSEIFTKNIAQIAAGDPCDVIVSGLESVETRSSNSQLTKLNDLLPANYLDNFYDTFSTAVENENGEIYAVPLVGDTRFIYYNMDMFNEIGVSEENGNMPTTWEELQSVAYQLDKFNSDGTLDVMGFHPYLGNGVEDVWFMNANQGVLWYDTKTDEAVINTKENIDAISYIDSYTEHYSRRSFDDYRAAFSSGMADPFCSEKLGMVIQTNAYVAAINQNAPDLNYGIMLMPEMVEGNGNATTGGGFSIEIPHGAKNPEASMKFIEWMTSPEIQAYWALNMGEVPTRNDVTDAELQERLVYQKTQESLLQTYIHILPIEVSDMKSVITPMIDLAIAGQVTPEKALEDAEKTVIATYGIEAK